MNILLNINYRYLFLFHRNVLETEKCIIRELQKCSGSTPANVVESVFKLIHNSTACSRFSMQELDPEYNTGVSIYQSMLTIIIPALTILLVRTFNSS